MSRVPTNAGRSTPAPAVPSGTTSAAARGDRVFMVTDNAHVIALDRSAGTLLWDSEMADWRQNYYATTAPLIAGGLVLAGVAGGDDGVRGFVAAFDAASGKEAWRSTPVGRLHSVLSPPLPRG